MEKRTVQLNEGEGIETLMEGELKIIQNANFYRFTSDSVLLTKFVKAKARERVADFCAGSGVVGLHFYALNPKVESVTLFEMQEELFDMSRRSIELNGLQNFTAVHTKIQEIGKEYDDYFSLVLVNPPYERGGFEKEDYKKAICRKEITLTLAEVVEAAYRKLKFGGRLAMVHRADRTAEILYALKSRGLEPKRLQFVCSTPRALPYLILVEAVKGGKEGTAVLQNLVLN